VKHEALAVRRGRAGVAGEEFDLDAVPAVAQRSVEERLESAERVERSAEVMRRLKRDEARALMLKAEGLSYVEIGERLGWTYTKVYFQPSGTTTRHPILLDRERPPASAPIACQGHSRARALAAALVPRQRRAQGRFPPLAGGRPARTSAARSSQARRYSSHLCG
jgi:hypothetical protein